MLSYTFLVFSSIFFSSPFLITILIIAAKYSLPDANVDIVHALLPILIVALGCGDCYPPSTNEETEALTCSATLKWLGFNLKIPEKNFNNSNTEMYFLKNKAIRVIVPGMISVLFRGHIAVGYC